MSWVRRRTGPLILFFLVPLQAARLPCRIYTLADGLPHNYVTSVIQDSRGLIWLGTAEGLARFDGFRFRTYDERDGLADSAVSFVYETRDGSLWAGTARGLCQLLPQREDGRAFRCWAPPARRAGDRAAAVMYEDSRGELWLGTKAGLFRVLREPAGRGDVRFEPVDLGLPPEEEDRAIRGMCEEASGRMWASGGAGLFRWSPGGRVDRFTTREGLPQREAGSVLCDSRGRVWAGLWDQGLVLLKRDPMPGKPSVEGTYRLWGPDGGNHTRGLLETSDGRILAAGDFGLLALEAEAIGGKLRGRRYGRTEGLGSDLPTGIFEDREGNLWAGSSDGGVTKILRHGFVLFGQEAGLSRPGVAFLADLAGVGLVAGRSGYLSSFEGEQFHQVRLNLPASMFADATRLGWAWGQSMLRDREGDWWISTDEGIFRFGRTEQLQDLATARPKAHYTTRDGLATDQIFRLFEDSRGNIWISLLGTDRPVVEWVRKQGKFVTHEIRDAAGRLKSLAAMAFTEDRQGNVWVGFWDAGLARRRGSEWDFFGEEAGGPAGTIVLLVDREGRLWAGGGDGLRRVDDPGAARPVFVAYRREQGLPSNYVTALGEDAYGRIYVGMHSMVVRFDPAGASGAGRLRLRHYGAGEGVPTGNVQTMIRDRHGTIWIGGGRGAARLEPEPRQATLPWPVRFMVLEQGGTPMPLSEFGERHLKGYKFPEKSGALDVGFFSPGTEGQRDHASSYLLEGSGPDWSPLAAGGSLTLAGLKPGRYRLLVKSSGAEEAAAPEPASLEFVVTAPLYRQGWFLGLMGVLTALIVLCVNQMRCRRALALEQMRMQIATDLHDELGAGLTQVALTSEMARVSGDEEARREALAQAALLARQMIGAMSDLVWTIRHSQDGAEDLVRRMRAFAAEILSTANFRLDFEASREALRARLDPEQRRQILAVFKEALHNIVKHSGGSSVRVRVDVRNGSLILSAADDGRGMEQQAGFESNGGHGIAGMKWRAQVLGGRLDLAPAGEKGLEVTLVVPLQRGLKLARGQRRAGKAETQQPFQQSKP